MAPARSDLSAVPPTSQSVYDWRSFGSQSRQLRETTRPCSTDAGPSQKHIWITSSKRPSSQPSSGSQTLKYLLDQRGERSDTNRCLMMLYTSEASLSNRYHFFPVKIRS